MWSENIRQRLREATQEEDTDVSNWEKVVAIMNSEFLEKPLEKACAWKMVC